MFATVCSLLSIAGSGLAQGASPVPPPADPTAPARVPADVAPEAPPVPRHSLLTAIDVEPGATCLAADKLVRRVERWLNQTKVDARIRVLVRGDDSDAYKVEFSIDRGDGQKPAIRRIDDAPADCEQLHSALALSIALAIDASILGGGELPDDDILLEEPEQPAAAEPAYLRVALGVLGQVSTGLVTSDLAWGASGRLELGLVPWLDLRLGAVFASAGGQRVEAVPGTYEASIVAGRADVCGAYEPAAVLRLLACASGVVGEFRTAGHDYTESSKQQGSLWTAAGGGIEMQALILDRLALALSADLLVPFARRSIRVVDTTGMTRAERKLTSVGVVIGVGAVFRVF